MKHLLLALATTIAAAVFSAAATGITPDTDYVHIPTVTDLFARAPRSVFPLLDRNTRLDMIDYHNSGLDTPSRNIVGGRSRITAVTDRSLDLSMSAASSYHMALLDARGDTVIALVRTVLLPTPDSDLSLYTTGWQPIEATGLIMPDIDQWLIKGVKGNDPDLVNLVPFVTTTITVEGDTVTLRPSLERRYMPDDSARIADAMRPAISYKWDGGSRRFKPMK